MSENSNNTDVKSPYHGLSYEQLKDNTRLLLSKELDNKERTLVQSNYGAWKEACMSFNKELGLDLPRQTFKNFFLGSRFSLPFVYIFSQYVNKPMTYFFGSRVFANEQAKIFSHYQLKPLAHIVSSDIACALPKDQVTNTDYTKVFSLPNDVRHYRKGSMCLIDITKSRNTETGIYLVKSKEGALKAMELSESGQTETIGLIKSVLCSV